MSEVCGFDEAWIGICKNPKPCEKHPPRECQGCGQPATRSCDHTGILVCGVPLCAGCRHCPPPKEGPNWFGLAGEHKPRAVADEEWRQIYASWDTPVESATKPGTGQS